MLYFAFFDICFVYICNKLLRIEKGLSQQGLAKCIGVSQKAIDYWERKVNEPKASYIIALVNTFAISFDDFFVEIN